MEGLITGDELDRIDDEEPRRVRTVDETAVFGVVRDALHRVDEEADPAARRVREQHLIAELQVALGQAEARAHVDHCNDATLHIDDAAHATRRVRQRRQLHRGHDALDDADTQCAAQGPERPHHQSTRLELSHLGKPPLAHIRSPQNARLATGCRAP